mmetsp:Transcript_105742/g.256886  ORF Transcript_105742/g.256886 Transcript_105742/m.256886 type:complete len:518 (+) Transcript_105742:640-2193(+)
MEARVVELVKPVLRHVQQLLRSCVGSHQLVEVLVLRLALLRGLRHRLVELLDGLLECLDLFLGCADGLLGVGDGSLQVRGRALQALELVLGAVELLLAVLLLMLVIHLLGLERRNHGVDHFQDLLEADLLALQRHGQEVQVGAARSVAPDGFPDHGQGALPLFLAPGVHLHEARPGARQGLLEEVQGVVAVEDLDGLGDGHELLRPRLHSLLPLPLLLVAAGVQVTEELLVLQQCLLSVREVILHLHDLHGELAAALHLGLEGLREGGHLLLLGGHELLEVLDGRLLGGSGLIKALGHVRAQLLQDAHDLAAPGRVAGALAAAEEGQHGLAVHVEHVLRGHDVPQHLRAVRLEEATRHALGDGRHGRGDGLDVRAQHGLLLPEGRGLLLAHGRGFLHCRLGCAAVNLVLLEILLKLDLLTLSRLDRRTHGGDFGLGCGDALLEVATTGPAIADKLVVQLLLLFPLLLHLLLHGLQHVYNLADGVCSMLLLHVRGRDRGQRGEGEEQHAGHGGRSGPR